MVAVAVAEAVAVVSSWRYFPHEQARSRAYRWGEDGLLGIHGPTVPRLSGAGALEREGLHPQGEALRAHGAPGDHYTPFPLLTFPPPHHHHLLPLPPPPPPATHHHHRLPFFTPPITTISPPLISSPLRSPPHPFTIISSTFCPPLPPPPPPPRPHHNHLLLFSKSKHAEGVGT